VTSYTLAKLDSMLSAHLGVEAYRQQTAEEARGRPELERKLAEARRGLDAAESALRPAQERQAVLEAEERTASERLISAEAARLRLSAERDALAGETASVMRTLDSAETALQEMAPLQQHYEDESKGLGSALMDFADEASSAQRLVDGMREDCERRVQEEEAQRELAEQDLGSMRKALRQAEYAEQVTATSLRHVESAYLLCAQTSDQRIRVLIGALENAGRPVPELPAAECLVVAGGLQSL
jgi:hypothetical protein